MRLGLVRIQRARLSYPGSTPASAIRPVYALGVTTVPVLRLDPDLAAGIVASKRTLAERSCQARVLDIPRGAWNVEDLTAGDRSGFGLLLLSGILCRRVTQRHHHGAELVGPGDLLRPWDRVGEWSSIPASSDWQALVPARAAVLDANFSGRASPYPEIAVALVRRGVLRSRHLAILVAILRQRKVETRLHLLFWHLADRFGQVRGDGVHLDLPLTHSLLSELVAARRPSVTTALSNLDERGILRREGEEWLLRGPCPTEFGELRGSAGTASRRRSR